MPNYGFSGNPLASDSSAAYMGAGAGFGGSPTGLDMAGAPQSPMGLQPMPSMAGHQQRLAQIANQPLLTPAAPSQQSQIYLSPSTGQMVVNGFTFDQRNATQGLASEQYARQPAQQFTLPDTATDWRPVSAPEYANYLDGIKNPSYGTRMSESWENAWRGVGDSYIGSALAVNPNWDWGQQAHQNILREYEENAPFMMQMRDVSNVGEGLTYASQMLVQGGPWLIDTLAWMAAGAVATGGVGAPVGSTEALIAREAIRRGTANAIRTNLTNGARAYEAARAANAGRAVTRAEVLAHAAPEAADDINRFFNFGERSFQLTRGAGLDLAGPGAQGASMISNYRMGVGDIRNSIADAGGDPTSAESIAQIWGMALPYAAIESVGDIIVTQPLTHLIPGLENGASRVGNALRGAGLNAGAEFVQESSQYGITQNAAAVATHQPLSIEPMDLLEQGVGGALAGAGVGAFTGAIGTPNRPTSTVLPSTPGGATPVGGAPGGPSAPTDLLRMSGDLAAIRERDRVRREGPLSSGLFSEALSGTTAYDQNTAWPTGNNMRPGGIDYGLMSRAMAGNNTTAPPVAPDPTLNNDLTRMSGTLAGIRAQNDGGAYMGAVQDQLRGMPPAQTPEAAEADRLYRLLDNPALTGQERDNIMQAIQSLGRNRTNESYDRPHGMHNTPSGTETADGNVHGPMYNEEQVVGLRGDEARLADINQAQAEDSRITAIQSMDRNNTEFPPGLGAQKREGLRDPRAIWTDLTQGIQVSDEEIIQLRDAVAQLSNNDPSNYGLSQVFQQLTSMLSRQPIDDSWVPSSEPYISPMDAARAPGFLEQMAAQQAERNKQKAAAVQENIKGLQRAGKMQPTITPAEAERLQAEANAKRAAAADGLRGRTEKAKEDEAPVDPKADEQARRAIKDTERHLAERNRMEADSIEHLNGRTKPRKKVDGAVLPKLESKRAQELVGRLGKKFGPRKDTGKDFNDTTLYPLPPKNKAIKGVAGTATVRPLVPEETARFVTEDETLEVSWAEGGKIFMPAYTYYVYDGTPVRRDIYEETRVPVSNSKFGQDGTFRMKAGLVFDFIVAEKPGNIKTLEAPKDGQDYKAGDLIFRGVSGERWNQSAAKAAKKYKLKIEEVPDAVQERSPKEISVREQPRASEETGSRDAPRSEAPRTSSEKTEREKVRAPEVNPDDEEVVIKAGLFIVSKARIDKAWAAGVADPKYPTLYSLKQSAAGIASRSKTKVELPTTTKQEWAIVDGRALSRVELSAIVHRMERLGVGKDTPMGTVTPKAETKAAPKAEKLKKPKPAKTEPLPPEVSAFEIEKARRETARAEAADAALQRSFGSDMSKFWFDPVNKDRPDVLAEYVRKNLKEIQSWMTSKDALEGRAGLRVRVEKYLPKTPPTDGRAVPAMSPPNRKIIQFMDPAVWGEDTRAALIKARNAVTEALSRTAEKVHHFKLEFLGRVGKEPQLYIINDAGTVFKSKTPVAKGFIAKARQIANVTDTTVPSLQQNLRLEPDFLNASQAVLIESSSGLLELRMPEELSQATVDRLLAAVNATPHNNIRVVQMDKDGRQHRSDGKTAALDAIYGAVKLNMGKAALSPGEASTNGTPSIKEMEDIIKGVQVTVSPTIKFKTTHVFKDAADLASKADTITLTYKDGHKYSLREVLAFVLPSKPTTLAELEEAVSGTQALNILGWKTLLVFHGEFASLKLDERKFIEVLEHEYVGHFGMQIMFPNKADRMRFLHRFGAIPGVEEMRQKMLFRFPGYRQYTIPEQYEELICMHAEHGPLALQKLLEAKEAVDPVTRHTLWQDFFDLVMDWLQRAFGSSTRPADVAINTIVQALKQHAITDMAIDLNHRLDALGIPSFEEVYKAELAKAGIRITISDAKAALSPNTLDGTKSTLYGGPTNPGRPYTPEDYVGHLKSVLESSQDTLDKAKAIGSAAGTSFNEALKNASMLVEPSNNMAMRSVLMEKTMDIMHNTIKVARRIMTKRQETRKYATKSKETAGIRRVFGDKDEGATNKEWVAYDHIAIVATNNKLPQTTEKVVQSSARIVTQLPNGTWTIVKNAYDKNDVAEALLVLGTLTKEELEAGVPQYVVSGDGEATEVEVAKLPQAMIDAAYEKIYVPESRHLMESHLEVLENTLVALNARHALTIEEQMALNPVKAMDRPFMNEMLARMHKLYSDIAFHNYTTNSHRGRKKQIEKARHVLAELMRTMHNADKVKDWTDSTVTGKKGPRANDAFKWREQTDPHKDVVPFTAQIHWFLDNVPGTTTTRLQYLHDMNVVKGDPQKQYDMLGAFQHLLLQEVQVREMENKVIQSTLGNYVEFVREGNHRLYIDVLDEKGDPADISPAMRALLPVTYTNSEREAVKKQGELQEALAGKHTLLNALGEEITVTFVVGRGDAPGVSTIADGPSIMDFVRIGEVANLAFNAEQMGKISNLLAHASERKRFGLQRAGTPGMDRNILENNGKVMTRRAWQAAKASQAYMLDSVFADNKNIFGDWDKLKRLQDEFDIANRGAVEGKNPPTNFIRNKDRVWIAETRLIRYANQLRYMSTHTTARPTVNIRTTKGESKFPITPEGRRHQEHAVALRESLKRNELEVNLNDVISKTGPLRMMSVVMQLGNIAAAIMNAFTLITHLPHVLAARNWETGYGEGHSYSDIMAELINSFFQVFPKFGMEDSAQLKETLDKAKAGNNKTGLTIDELEFMYKETLEGLLMPQQTYSMSGGTESNIGNLVLRNLAQWAMAPFGATEAGNRRTTALVTYRLTKKRMLGAGMTEAEISDMASQAFADISKTIENVVYNSQGDYSNVNRPKVARGDLAQYVLQYKMFPLMTVVMLNNLPRAQQGLFLGVLFLLAGLKGEPFADDFMDIYDTLLQKLGFSHDSVELQLVQALEQVAPGSSKWVMHGFVDSATFGGTMSSRLAMGDILPLTGVLRPGVDIGRELSNAFGPAYASNLDVIEFIGASAEGIAQIVGVKDQTMTMGDWVRSIPQSQVRAIGEGVMMAQSGQIVDPRGRLVSDEVTFGAIVNRMLGFYPLEASRANDAVRLDRMHTGYMKAVRARYILAYANAYRSNDQARMDSIRRTVDEWNAAAEQTGQEDMTIRNFRSAAIRAGRAASQTTIERTSKGAPDYSVIDELAQIVGADTESEDN